MVSDLTATDLSWDDAAQLALHRQQWRSCIARCVQSPGLTKV